MRIPVARRSRQVKGTPAGGEFAAETRPSPDISLARSDGGPYPVSIEVGEQAEMPLVTDLEWFGDPETGHAAALLVNRARQDGLCITATRTGPNATAGVWRRVPPLGDDGRPVVLAYSTDEAYDAYFFDLTLTGAGGQSVTIPTSCGKNALGSHGLPDAGRWLLNQCSGAWEQQNPHPDDLDDPDELAETRRAFGRGRNAREALARATGWDLPGVYERACHRAGVADLWHR